MAASGEMSRELSAGGGQKTLPRRSLGGGDPPWAFPSIVLFCFVVFHREKGLQGASAGPGCPRFPFRFGTSPPPLPAFLSFLSRLVVGSGRSMREIRWIIGEVWSFQKTFQGSFLGRFWGRFSYSW